MGLVEALLPPCITFWDVVLGNIVNSVTLSLHKAKNAALFWISSMLLSNEKSGTTNTKIVQ